MTKYKIIDDFGLTYDFYETEEEAFADLRKLRAEATEEANRLRDKADRLEADAADLFVAEE